MCTVLLPPGVNPTALNKYIKINTLHNSIERKFMTLHTCFTKWSYEHRPTTTECRSVPELIQQSWSCGCQTKLHTSLIFTWSYLFTLLSSCLERTNFYNTTKENKIKPCSTKPVQFKTCNLQCCAAYAVRRLRALISTCAQSCQHRPKKCQAETLI